MSSAMRMNSRPSSIGTPEISSVSAAIRTAMATSSPTASLTALIASSQNRERFSSEPPYSSVRLL